MWKNYLKISIRNLLYNKVSSFINISGLAAGMTIALLIGLWIWDEFSFNTYHKHYDQIAQVIRLGVERDNGEKYHSTSHPTALAGAIRSAYGNHFERVVMLRETEEYLLSVGDKTLRQKGNFMETEGPELLSLQMVKGKRDVLQDMNTIIISESLAEKLFASENPMSQTIKIGDGYPLKVGGVYKDLPQNTTFSETQFIISLELLFAVAGMDANAWTNYNMEVYAQLRPSSDIDEVSKLIKNVLYDNLDENKAKEDQPELFLHPMHKWHIYSEFENGVQVANERLSYIWFNGLIGIFVLLLACINFMNLSTARSEKRAKEVGIRKTIGSSRGQLIQQFFSESLLLSLLAFLVAINLVQFALPWFNQLAAKDIRILWGSPVFWLLSLGFTLFTGVLAGAYPAIYLSSFHPIKTLKGSISVGRAAGLPRRVLVVFQFSISIALIIGTIIVYQQIQHVKNRPLGYSQDGLISLVNRGFEKSDVLRQELKKTGMIKEFAQAHYEITDNGGSNNGFTWPGKSPSFDPSFNTIKVSHEYGETVGWQIVRGRDFSRKLKTDETGVILSESAVKMMRLEDPVGQIIHFESGYFGGPNFRVLGVVKNLVKGSPFELEQEEPPIFFLSEDELSFHFIKIKPQVSTREALAKIEEVYHSIFPDLPFDYKFVDEEYATKFQEEEVVAQLVFLFAVLAIFISCLGLFGLAVFIAERRTKEVCIRKVLGASIFSLWRLLSKEFVILVLLSSLVATPIAYYFMQNWLSTYEYRVDISWIVFVLTGLGALFIALFTVSFQSIRVARLNPVNSLRNE